MKKIMIYSPELNIPIGYMIFIDDYHEPLIELKNPRTGKTEALTVSSFKALLTRYASLRFDI